MLFTEGMKREKVSIFYLRWRRRYNFFKLTLTILYECLCCLNCLQVKSLAREIYNEYFKKAETMPRSVVCTMQKIVQKLEGSCAKQITQVKVRHIDFIIAVIVARVSTKSTETCSMKDDTDRGNGV